MLAYKLAAKCGAISAIFYSKCRCYWGMRWTNLRLNGFASLAMYFLIFFMHISGTLRIFLMNILKLINIFYSSFKFSYYILIINTAVFWKAFSTSQKKYNKTFWHMNGSLNLNGKLNLNLIYDLIINRSMNIMSTFSSFCLYF